MKLAKFKIFYTTILAVSLISTYHLNISGMKAPKAPPQPPKTVPKKPPHLPKKFTKEEQTKLREKAFQAQIVKTKKNRLNCEKRPFKHRL